MIAVDRGGAWSYTCAPFDGKPLKIVGNDTLFEHVNKLF